MIAQQMLLAAPDRVEALILMDTAHGRLEGALDAAMIDAGDRLHPSQRDRGLEADDGVAGRPRLSTPADLRVSGRATRLRRVRRAQAARASRRRWCASVLGQFAHRRRPARTAGGTHDPDARDRRASRTKPFIGPSERMADVMPGASLAVIPDGGHSPQFEIPRRVVGGAERVPRSCAAGGSGVSETGTPHHTGDAALEVLRGYGVDAMFTLNGGHVWPLYDARGASRTCASSTCATSRRRRSRPRAGRSSPAGRASPCSPPGRGSPTV